MANGTKKIPQFYQNPTANSGMKFLIYDVSQSDDNKKDQLVAFNLIQQLLTQGIQITISGLMTSVNNLTTQVAGKIDLAEKGANGGVATLGGNGKVLTTQMPFDLSSLVGVWDADTNTPTLSDGTGVDKTAYIVSVAGTQNLGSGSFSVVEGNIIIHLRGTWQPVFTTVVLGVTTINNSLTGNVDLTTAITAEVADKRYINDNQKAALIGTAGVPSALNPFVTTNDPRLTGGSLSVTRNPFHTVSKYEVNNIEGGTGGDGYSTLSSLGISAGAANALFPNIFAEYGAIPNGSVFYDECTLYEALLACRNNGIPNLHLTGKTYGVSLTFGDEMPLPKTLGNLSATTGALRFSMFGYGCQVRLLSSGAGKIFMARSPVNEAESQSIAPMSVWIDGIKFQGDSNTTLKGIRLCSTKASKISNCIFRGMGTELEMRFCLSATLDTNRFFGATVRSIYAGSGDWSGATSSSSTTQFTAINQYLTIGLGLPGYEIINTDSCNIIGGVWENSVLGLCGVKYQNTGTTVCKDLHIQGVHVEQNFSEAAVYATCQDSGIISIEDIFEQNVAFLLSVNSVSGTNRFVLKRIAKSGGFQFRNQGGAGTAISFEDVKLPNNPVSAAQVVDPLNAVFDLSGSYVAPQVGRIKINPLTL